jgi:integrase
LVATIGKEMLYKTLQSNNRRAAEIEARDWENGLKAKWAALTGNDSPALQGIRRERLEYDQVRLLATSGHYRVEIAGEDPSLAGIDYEIEKIAERNEQEELSSLDIARLAALNDASRELQGQEVPQRPELEPTFSELANEFVKWWKAQASLKESNTEQQKRATYKLFAGFSGDKPLRRVRKEDAAKFLDAVRLMDSSWGRSPAARELSWAELQRKYGGRDKGLSDATMNRHADALQQLWKWGEERGHCVGRNPFDGFRKRLKPGVNVKGYVPWETQELRQLFDPLPKRSDLVEVMLVGMFTGMRLNEIASLTGTQLLEEEGVTFIQVVDAKTPAGNRQVPLHSRLEWLKDRAKKAGADRIWPTFNPEGPGKKAGADAGKEFSRLKIDRGFTDRRKAFHSFRKNVTRIMERARVRENEWAQVFGHEKGFTYGRYNEEGLTLAQKGAIIAHIAYPGLELPVISTAEQDERLAA